MARREAESTFDAAAPYLWLRVLYIAGRFVKALEAFEAFPTGLLIGCTTEL